MIVYLDGNGGHAVAVDEVHGADGQRWLIRGDGLIHRPQNSTIFDLE